MKRGEVRWARLSPVEGHEQAGHRPVLIVSDDRYMQRLKLAVVFPLTTSARMLPPLAVELLVQTDRRSFALPGQVRALAVTRIGALLATASEREMTTCLDAFLHLCGRAPAWKADNDG